MVSVFIAICTHTHTHLWTASQNANATIRNETDAWAAKLSAVYPAIIAQFGNSGRWKNFDLHFYQLDFNDIVKTWIAQGGEPYQLVEPVDGFHPSQIGDTLLAERHVMLFEQAGLLPPINPKNSLIVELFGDQGGY